MRNNFKYTIFIFLIGFTIYGQNQINVKVDSTKIEIIGNSVYKVHKKSFYQEYSRVVKVDSTRLAYTKIEVDNILFRRSKSEILPESKANLDEVLLMLKNNPKVKIKINGFTDKVGNGKSNLELSIIRARMIKIYLMQGGIKADRIETKGFGDGFPICKSPCKNNQRVEFILAQN